VIAGQAVAKANPDGYTLLLIHSGHAVNPWTVKALPYDTLKDFAAVAKLGTAPLLLVASAQSGVRNMAELLAYARTNPDKMSFGSTEITSRLASEQVLKAAGVKGVVVNYRGLAQALTDASGGSVNFVFTTISAALPFKDTGKVNFIGLAASRRSPFLPNLPTLAEQGNPMDVQTWYGLAAPAGTPQDVLDRLGREIGQIVRNPEFESKLRTLAIQPDFATGRELDALIRAEFTRWGEMIKAAGIQPE
jgi:tripartite-type tricarboxylate transporter receptor subunit TctC